LNYSEKETVPELEKNVNFGSLQFFYPGLDEAEKSKYL
jgi:hypothetical protein